MMFWMKFKYKQWTYTVWPYENLEINPIFFFLQNFKKKTHHRFIFHILSVLAFQQLWALL